MKSLTTKTQYSNLAMSILFLRIPVFIVATLFMLYFYSVYYFNLTKDEITLEVAGGIARILLYFVVLPSFVPIIGLLVRFKIIKNIILLNNVLFMLIGIYLSLNCFHEMMLMIVCIYLLCECICITFFPLYQNTTH